MLPLDLHVLGLPLAFILSQDQTLHRVFINNLCHNADKKIAPKEPQESHLV